MPSLEKASIKAGSNPAPSQNKNGGEETSKLCGVPAPVELGAREAPGIALLLSRRVAGPGNPRHSQREDGGEE